MSFVLRNIHIQTPFLKQYILLKLVSFYGIDFMICKKILNFINDFLFLEC